MWREIEQVKKKKNKGVEVNEIRRRRKLKK